MPFERQRLKANDVTANDDLTVGDDTTLADDVALAAGSVLTWATDTNLYRSAANTLKTDDGLIIGGSVGFYGHAVAAKPEVTGSRGSNAALASLLTALAGLGLITDSSS